MEFTTQKVSLKDLQLGATPYFTRRQFNGAELKLIPNDVHHLVFGTMDLVTGANYSVCMIIELALEIFSSDHFEICELLSQIRKVRQPPEGQPWMATI